MLTEGAAGTKRTVRAAAVLFLYAGRHEGLAVTMQCERRDSLTMNWVPPMSNAHALPGAIKGVGQSRRSKGFLSKREWSELDWPSRTPRRYRAARGVRLSSAALQLKLADRLNCSRSPFHRPAMGEGIIIDSWSSRIPTAWLRLSPGGQISSTAAHPASQK